MYCPVCGAKVAANTALCPSCGMSIDLRLYSLEPERTEQELAKTDVQQNAKFAFLAYLGPLIIVPASMSKKSAFLRFHVNQGAILCIGYLISLLSFCLPDLALLSWGLLFVTAVFSALGVQCVLHHETKELPGIGNFKIIKNKEKE